MSSLPPNIDERLYPSYKIALLVGVLREQGVAPAESLGGTGLEAGVLALPGTRISYRQLLTVYENAIALAREPAIALRAGRRAHITDYGLFGYALLSSPSNRAACEFAVRYQKLVAPTVQQRLHENDGVAAWLLESVFDLDRGGALYRFMIEFQLAINLSLIQDCVGTDAKPREALVVYEAPAHAAAYRDYLECPVHFGQPENQLRFDAAILDGRPNLANPITAAMLRETCDRMLAEMQTSTGLAAKVHGMLLRTPGEFPNEDEMAARLYMVARSLRRKLAAEGTSYKQILGEVRKQLALKYLRETRLSVDDIATALGFSDASSFRQAFKRWTDRNPSDYRSQ
jgi:AraC-like DNA-binding protein